MSLLFFHCWGCDLLDYRQLLGSWFAISWLQRRMQASMKCFCFSVLGSFCGTFGFGVNFVCAYLVFGLLLCNYIFMFVGNEIYLC